MNYKLLSSSLSIVLAIFLIGHNSLSFNPIRFHCPNYILNSFLYLFLSIAILASSILSIESQDVNINKLFAGNSKYLLLILSLMIIFGLVSMSPKYFLTKHILWIMFIILLGVFLYPIYKEKRSIFYQAGLTTVAIITALSFLAFMKPDLIKDSWFMPLFIGLIALIVSQISERLLANWGIIHATKYNKLFSYIAIGLFSLWTLFDTKQIIKNAENCVNPDYINQSLDVLLDSLNIFTGIVNISE